MTEKVTFSHVPYVLGVPSFAHTLLSTIGPHGVAMGSRIAAREEILLRQSRTASCLVAYQLIPNWKPEQTFLTLVLLGQS